MAESYLVNGKTVITVELPRPDKASSVRIPLKGVKHLAKEYLWISAPLSPLVIDRQSSGC
jgi:hypothetical protein